MMGDAMRPMVRIEHEPLDTDLVPLAAFVRANYQDDEAMEALASLIAGRELETVVGGGAGPVAVLSLVFVY